MPILLIALIVPPLISEANDFADNVPRYADDVTNYVQKNRTLRNLNEDYDITDQAAEGGRQAAEPARAAPPGTLRDIGLGIVNSLFALLTILVMTAFLLGSGGGWTDQIIRSRPPEQRERLRRSLDNIGSAVSGYVAGALAIAFIAGTATFIVLTILGVPFAGPLAVMAGFASLIPLVGATIAAVLIGVVTVFNDFPTDTIIWTIWAIAYQQIENNLIQPQIQKRTVNVQPLITIVAVLFGAHAARRAGRDRRHPDRRLDPDPAARVRGPADVLDEAARAAARAGRARTRVASGSMSAGRTDTPRDPSGGHRVSLYLLAPALLEVFGAFDELDEIAPWWFPAMVAASDRQLRVHVGRPAPGRARGALGAGDHLAAGVERVRPRRARAAWPRRARCSTRCSCAAACRRRAAASGMTASSLLLFGTLLALPLLALPAVLGGVAGRPPPRPARRWPARRCSC